MVGYPTYIVAQYSRSVKSEMIYRKSGLLGGSAYVDLFRGQLVGTDIGENNARAQMVTVNG